MMRVDEFPPGDWSPLIIGHQWPSDEAVAQVDYWKANREYVATGHEYIANSLQAAKDGPLATQEGMTADALVEAFDEGERLARKTASKNRGKATGHDSVLGSLRNLRNALYDIAERGNKEIKEIQDSKEAAPVKVSKILAVVGLKQQEANVAAAKCGAEIGDAGQRILDMDNAGQSFRQFAQDNGIDMSQLFRSRKPEDLKPIVAGMFNNPGVATGLAGNTAMPHEINSAEVGPTADMSGNCTNPLTVPNSVAGVARGPAASPPAGAGSLAGTTGSGATPQIVAASFGSSGPKPPAAPSPATPSPGSPGPSVGSASISEGIASPLQEGPASGLSMAPTPDSLASPVSHGPPPAPSVASLPEGSAIAQPATLPSTPPSPPPPPIPPTHIPTSPTPNLSLPTTPATPTLPTAPSMPSAPTPLQTGLPANSWVQSLGLAPTPSTGFDAPPPPAPPPPPLPSPQTTPSAGVGDWNGPFAAHPPAAPQTPAYTPPPEPIMAPPPAVPPSPPTGPLPAYGADLRPPIPTATAPSPPPPPSAPPPPGPLPSTSHPSAGGVAQGSAPVRTMPTEQAPQAQPPQPPQPPQPALAGQGVAAAAGGAVVGAVSADATARARLQRLVDAVARQQPRLAWAAGDRPDKTTVLVTDLARGWIPPGIDLPAAVTLLDPAPRRGDLESLLGDATVTASYTPAHYVPDEDQPTPTSPRPRRAPQVDDLGWELNQATRWRDGLPRLAHTLAKAASAGTGVLDSETELLHEELGRVRERVLDSYPGTVDSATVGNWQLLAAIAALVDGDKAAANYHVAWFQATTQATTESATQAANETTGNRP